MPDTDHFDTDSDDDILANIAVEVGINKQSKEPLNNSVILFWPPNAPNIT